jgi:transcriptional regulator with XRE-family HTH domain
MKGSMRFSDDLREWRAARRLSQLDLALEAGVSARHVSFLETGRARPSREMVERLGEALRLPLAARNRMLSCAGFAARYPARDLDSEAMAPIRAAIERMLDRHEPWPGFAIDRLWVIRRLNRAATALFAPLGLREGGSLLDVLLSGALVPLVENWPDVARHTAQRLRAESLDQGGVAVLDDAARRLAGTAGPPAAPVGPVVPVVLRLGETRLSLFATVAQFGTPEDVTLADLRIELFFPADAVTEAALAGDGTAPAISAGG